jgi:predicted nucleic acid-binding protein
VLTDVTIDTNVFLHAANEQEQRCAASKTFLQGILETDTTLCIDEGFDTDESKNRSIIGGEYIENLRFVDSAFAIIKFLGEKGRISELPRSVGAATNRRILQMVRNTKDRTFLKVSYNSQSRVFVSHDFQDFAAPKRGEIRSALGVAMVEARQASDMNRRD